MRKKLAGIHLLAPLSETDIVDYSRNLDRELIVNSTIVTDAIVDTVEKTNYIVTFEYDTTLDGGTHQIRRSIPTLELLSYTGENMSGAHWVNVEDMDYHYITSGTSSQQAFEELDEQLSKVCFLKHLVDGVGDASLISSNDNKTPLSTVDNSEYAFVLGNIHTLTASNYGVILGGYDSNILSSLYSSIFNGYNNTITHSYASFINSGRNNTIDADTDSTFILSGKYNKIENAADSGIIGGHDNYIYGANNSYGSIIIGSVEGYIDSSHFSVISNTANSYITGGKYNEISVSSYIEIVNSSSSTISTCTNHLILNSEYVNIFASDASSQQLNVYNSNGAIIQSSLYSYIWYSTNVGISSSSICSIGYDSIPAAVSSISKTTSNLGISSVTNFNNGQLVSLIGAEYTSYITEYRISNIDTINNLLYFSNNDVNGTDITFNTSDSTPINIKPLNKLYESREIVSNTSDIIVCNLNISTAIQYAVIGNTKTKYTIIQVPNTRNMVQLKLYGSDTVITNLTPNEFYGMTIYTYSNNVNANQSIIGASRNTHISSVSNAIALGTGDCYIKNGGSGAILATSSSYLMNYNSTFIAGGCDHYINGTHNSAIIGGENSQIISATAGIIIGGATNKITSANNGIIIGGTSNTINADNGNLNNTVMIACNNKIADRSNALFTDSITLTERTLVLKDNSGTKTPQIGDVLLVESIKGNVATVTWGKPATSNSLFQSLTYTMWGESVISSAYIQVGPDSDSVDVENNMAVDLTTSGYINTNYTGSWDSNYIANSNDGITIEDGYRHVISIDSFDAKWVNASANAPSVNMSAPKITITESNNIVTYTTTAGVSDTLLDNDEITGCALITGFTASGSSEAILNLYIHRPTVNSPAIVTFSTCNIKESSEYIEGVATTMHINSDKSIYVYWPDNYALPVVDEYAWFKAVDAQISLNTYGIRYILSVDATTRLVRIGGASTLQEKATVTCYLWYMKETPRFRVTANISVLKISTDIGI